MTQVHARAKTGCDLCREQFKTEAQRNKHLLKIHSESKPYKCFSCPSRFTSKSELDTHVKRMHLRERRFQCQVCDQRFFSDTTRRKHLLTHGEERPFKCPECPAAFKVQGSMYRHANSHDRSKPHRPTTLMSDNLKLPCSFCDQVLANKNCLRRHLAQQHFRQERKQDCPECGLTLSSKSALMTHVKRVHGPDAPYECSVCKARFKVQNTLRDHFKVHTLDPEEKDPLDPLNESFNYECPRCLQTFDLLHDFNLHLKSYHPPRAAAERLRRSNLHL